MKNFHFLKEYDYDIFLGSRFLEDPHDLDLFMEKLKVKLPENRRDQMFIRIYADRSVPWSMIEILIKELQQYHLDGIYRVFQPNTQLYDYYHTIDRDIELYLYQ